MADRIGLFNWGLVEGKTQTYLSWNREENLLEGPKLDWQHDVLRKDFTPCREQILLPGGEGEKDLYLLIGLAPWEEFLKKKRRGILSEDDFICLRCRYNDPYVSFFTMCRGVLHGEAVGEGDGLPATFYVTEPSEIHLDVFPMENYKIELVF